MMFQNPNGTYYFIGLKLLIQLVMEFEDYTPGLVVTEHRKISNSFRDKSLFSIFEIALASLNDLFSNQRFAGIFFLMKIPFFFSGLMISFCFFSATICLTGASTDFGKQNFVLGLCRNYTWRIHGWFGDHSNSIELGFFVRNWHDCETFFGYLLKHETTSLTDCKFGCF